MYSGSSKIFRADIGNLKRLRRKLSEKSNRAAKGRVSFSFDFER